MPDDEITEWLPVEDRITDAITELRRVVVHTTIKDAINADGTLTGAGFIIQGADILAGRPRDWLREAAGTQRLGVNAEDLIEAGFTQIAQAWLFFNESNVKNFAAWSAMNGRSDAKVGIRWTGNGTIRASAVNAFGELIASATVKVPDTEWSAELDDVLRGEPVSTGNGAKFW